MPNGPDFNRSAAVHEVRWRTGVVATTDTDGAASVASLFATAGSVAAGVTGPESTDYAGPLDPLSGGATSRSGRAAGALGFGQTALSSTSDPAARTVLTLSGAIDAIPSADAALNAIADLNGSCGAIPSRCRSTVARLDPAVTNLRCA